VKVITFSQKVTVQTLCGEHKTALTCNPGERLLFDDDNALQIQSAANSSSYIEAVSDLDPMIKEIRKPPHWKKRRVLFYRNRGVGDQLIISAIGKFFREVLGADVRQLCDRVHETLWACNPYIANVPLSVPLHLDAVWRAKGRPFFDGAFFIESVSEWDVDSEQPNVYDRLYSVVGIDPATVPIKYKRPVFMLHADDDDKRSAWLRANGQQHAALGRYITVQLRAANNVRSVPPHIAIKVLQAASEVAQKKDLSVLVTDDRPLAPETALAIGQLKRVFDVAGKIPTVRLFGSLIGGSAAVVGPDSSALHFAAAFETPALGIWGPFAPDARCKYYPNQIHLFHDELCLNAPCYNYMPDLPYHKCPRGTKQTTCEVYEGVTVDEVYSALLELLR
jgi:glycosyl transferase family 9 (putative heptosyltransferase)